MRFYVYLLLGGLLVFIRVMRDGVDIHSVGSLVFLKGPVYTSVVFLATPGSVHRDLTEPTQGTCVGFVAT